MTDDLILWNFTFMQFVRKSMGSNSLSIDHELPVSLPHTRTNPYPAIFSFINFFKESRRRISKSKTPNLPSIFSIASPATNSVSIRKNFLAIVAIHFFVFLYGANVAYSDNTTNRLGLDIVPIGSPNWGSRVNGNFQIIDAFAGVTSTTNTFISSNVFTGYVSFTSTINLQNVQQGSGQCLGVSTSSDVVYVPCGGDNAYVRNGYSSRFMQNFNVTTYTNALDAILEFSYQPPSISLGSSPGAEVLELGTGISTITLSAITVETSSPIVTLAFKKGGTVFYNYPSPSPTGGTESYTDTATLTATTIYTATVGDGSGSTTFNSITFTFVYPFYYGVGAQALTGSQVQSLTKFVQVKQNITTSTSPNNQVYYFAYPQSYGSLTSIIDQNGFNTTAGYTQRSVTLTMMDSTMQPYYIYEFNTLTTQTNFKNTYNF